jgi:hypothetical protein
MAQSVLISKFGCVISRIDRAATAAPPAGTSFASGYDQIFQRPRSLPSGQQVGDSALIYQAPVQVEAQVEEFGRQKRLDQGVGGGDKSGGIELIFLRRDLQAIGWVTAGGRVDLVPGDRLDRIVDLKTGLVVIDVVEAYERELFVEDSELDGMGGLKALASSGLIDVRFVTRNVTR